MTNEFCDLVRSVRKSKYKTAKDFYRLKTIHCTYAYYSKVERDTVPDVKLALEIIDQLKINHRKALYAWVRDQMPTSEMKSLFTEIDDGPSLSSEQQSVERSTVVNRMQARMLIKNPVLWELIVYLSSHFRQRKNSVRQIARAFGMKLDDVNDQLNDLYEFGLIDKDESGDFVSKEWVFIPYENEFRSLRDSNFRRAFEQFNKVEEGSKFRTTITGLLGPADQKAIEAKVLALTNFIVDLSEKSDSKDAIPYTLGIFSAPRKFGNV